MSDAVIEKKEGPVLVETPMSLADAAQLKILDPKTLRFFQHAGVLRLSIHDNATHLKVSVLRAFPLTQPAKHFSIRDGGNKEIGVLPDLQTLDAESRRVVEAELERRYLVPTVQRVINVIERFGTVDWEVETSRGRIKFTTRDLRDNVVRPTPGRCIFTDVDGNRYDFPNTEAMDGASQAWLMQYV
jgi:hypothetical protein